MEPSANFNIPEATLKVTVQAGRPILGEFLQITLFSEGSFDTLLTQVLQNITEIEKTLDLDNPKAEIMQLLRSEGDDTFEMSVSVAQVVEAALDFNSISNGAFEPFREDAGHLDLRSLIRGHLVDQTVKQLLKSDPYLMGVVQLAEGMRFFNCPKKSIHVRMGGNFEIEKELGLFKNAFSTTEAGGSMFDNESATIYLQPLRHGLSGRHTVSVIADECMTANALSKVGLFADAPTVQKCVTDLHAQILIFDERGEIVEIYEEVPLSRAYSSDQWNSSYSSYDDSSKD
ncbi:MAG: FAD:protein FMN transferase [Bdellovibrio sp.]|nr:FAD:protein FMN transferase [Bdellovibrio sp.]